MESDVGQAAAFAIGLKRQFGPRALAVAEEQRRHADADRRAAWDAIIAALRASD